MAPREKPVVCGMSFGSQSALKDYVNGRKAAIGLTSSLRKSSETDVQFFYELVQRHPEAATKLENFADFMICNNAIGSGLEMSVVRSDGLPPVSFSLPTCIARKYTGTTQLIAAMRFAIHDQLMRFKETMDNRCPRLSPACTHIATEADHVNHFEQLTHEFLAAAKNPPTIFGKDKAKANMHCFLSVDHEFEESWQAYHQEKAVLRYLCGPCNRTRPKWTGPTP